MNKALLEEHFHANSSRYLSEWQTLLRFPSISTDPDHGDDCLDCANWLTEHLRAMGLTAELLDTPTKPVVFAEKPGLPGKPVVLFYGHYDVQPVDPLDAWQTPPQPFSISFRGLNHVHETGARDEAHLPELGLRLPIL